MTSAVAMSVRAAAVRVVPAVRVPSATVRGRSVVAMVAIVPTVRRVDHARMAIVRTVIARKATASGRGVISVIVRRVIALKATVLMVIAHTAIVPASSARKAIAPRATVPTVIVPTVIVPTVIVRKATARALSAIVRMAHRVAIAPMATARMATVRVRTAVPAASVAGVAQPSRL